MKLLIIDDSVVICDRLVELLSEIEDVSSIETAQDVFVGIEISDREKPDVVILDLRMPGGSGIDFLRHHQENDNKPVIIVLTNYPYQQYRKRCMELGADYFFDKTKEIDNVIEVISELTNPISQETGK